jgi:hypothetical protein
VSTPELNDREKLKRSLFDLSVTDVAIIVGELFGAAGTTAGGA